MASTGMTAEQLLAQHKARLAGRYITPMTKKQKIASFRANFAFFDIDNSGTMSAQECRCSASRRASTSGVSSTRHTSLSCKPSGGGAYTGWYVCPVVESTHLWERYGAIMSCCMLAYARQGPCGAPAQGKLLDELVRTLKKHHRVRSERRPLGAQDRLRLQEPTSGPQKRLGAIRGDQGHSGTPPPVLACEGSRQAANRFALRRARQRADR